MASNVRSSAPNPGESALAGSSGVPARISGIGRTTSVPVLPTRSSTEQWLNVGHHPEVHLPGDPDHLDHPLRKGEAWHAMEFGDVHHDDDPAQEDVPGPRAGATSAATASLSELEGRPDVPSLEIPAADVDAGAGAPSELRHRDVGNSAPGKDEQFGESDLEGGEKPPSGFAAWTQRAWLALAAPQKPLLGPFSRIMYYVLLIAAWYLSLRFIIGKSASPNGEVFALEVVWLCSLVVGELVHHYLGTHPLVGMIPVGFVLRYVPGVHANKTISPEVFSVIREVGLTTILIRGGLALDFKTLRKQFWLCLLMSFGPSAVGALSCMVLGNLILGFPYEWAALNGALLAAVSPAIVVPALLSLQERGYGIAKGIPSLVLAVAALNDVLAIVGFSVFRTAIFSPSTPLVELIFRFPVEVAIGTALGITVGVVVVILVPRGALKLHEHEHGAALKELEDWVPEGAPVDGPKLSYKRTFLLGGSALASVLGLGNLQYSGAGAMMALVSGGVVSQPWGRIRTGRVQSILAAGWIYGCQPLLFGVIGSRIDPKIIFQPSFLGKGLAVLVGALALRFASTIVFAMGSHLSVKERMFLGIAWIPKATVQAAVGPTAYVLALKQGTEQQKEWGNQVLALALLTIIITAPLGAISTSFFGPRLLTKNVVKPGQVPTLAAH